MRVFGWHQDRWPWMTLNCYKLEFRVIFRVPWIWNCASTDFTWISIAIGVLTCVGYGGSVYAGVQQQMIANSPEFLPVLPPPPRSYSSSSSSRNEPVDCVKSEEVSCIWPGEGGLLSWGGLFKGILSTGPVIEGRVFNRAALPGPYHVRAVSAIVCSRVTLKTAENPPFGCFHSLDFCGACVQWLHYCWTLQFTSLLTYFSDLHPVSW